MPTPGEHKTIQSRILKYAAEIGWSYVDRARRRIGARNSSPVCLRPMKYKWASCSSNGHLNFNDELLNIERELGEYVIVHELIHIRTPNHGPLWKSYMNVYLPDWEVIDNKLRKVTRLELIY